IVTGVIGIRQQAHRLFDLVGRAIDDPQRTLSTFESAVGDKELVDVFAIDDGMRFTQSGDSLDEFARVEVEYLEGLSRFGSGIQTAVFEIDAKVIELSGVIPRNIDVLNQLQLCDCGKWR